MLRHAACSSPGHAAKPWRGSVRLQRRQPQWRRQLTQVLAPAQAVLRSFGEAVAAVNSSDPGSLYKLEQLGKVAAYTTWLADPDAVASTFNGTVRPPLVPRSDIIQFAGAPASKAAPHTMKVTGASGRQRLSGLCISLSFLVETNQNPKRTWTPVLAFAATTRCRFQCSFPLHRVAPWAQQGKDC